MPVFAIDLNLAVTGLSVTLAVLMGVLLIVMLRRVNRTELSWKGRAKSLDAQISHYDSVFGAYPGLVLVWDGDVPTDGNEVGFGNPRVFGSTAALASMLRFSEPGRPQGHAHCAS